MSIICKILRGRKQRGAAVLLSILVSAAPRVTFGSIPPPNSRRVQTTRPFVDSKDARERENLKVITVDFDMSPGDEGVLISGGDYSEDFSLEVSDGRVIWAYACVFQENAVMTVSDRLSTGPVTVRYEFETEQPTELGKHRKGRMFVNGKLVDSSATFTFRPKSLDSLFLGFGFTGTIVGVSVHETPSP